MVYNYIRLERRGIMEKYFTPEQVAEQLQVRPRTVRNWLRDGDLEGQKISNQWRISYNDLQRFISKRKEDKGQTVVLPHDYVIDMPKPNKRSSNIEWEIYGRKLFTEMQKEGLEKYFQGMYITGDTGERYKSYNYKGESFRLFLSDNAMRIDILRPTEFMAPGGNPEDWEFEGIDVVTDVLLFSAVQGEFSQQSIKDSRRTKE